MTYEAVKTVWVGVTGRVMIVVKRAQEFSSTVDEMGLVNETHKRHSRFKAYDVNAHGDPLRPA